MTVDDELIRSGVYFGTTSGEVWASTDEGATWRRIAEHLPEIYSLEWAPPPADREPAGHASPHPHAAALVHGSDKVVEATGATVGEVLDDLDRQFPGIRFRVVDEQGRLRTHMKVFVGDEMTRDLATPLSPDVELTLMQALSGG